MGYLYYTHTDQSINSRIRKKVHASLEKRWKNADQDVFILALVFNPYIRRKAFKDGISFRTVAGLWEVVRRTYMRFYDKEPDGIFRKNFTEYLGGTGKWSDERMSLVYHRDDAKTQVCLLIHLIPTEF